MSNGLNTRELATLAGIPSTISDEVIWKFEALIIDSGKQPALERIKTRLTSVESRLSAFEGALKRDRQVQKSALNQQATTVKDIVGVLVDAGLIPNFAQWQEDCGKLRVLDNKARYRKVVPAEVQP